MSSATLVLLLMAMPVEGVPWRVRAQALTAIRHDHATRSADPEAEERLRHRLSSAKSAPVEAREPGTIAEPGGLYISFKTKADKDGAIGRLETELATLRDRPPVAGADPINFGPRLADFKRHSYGRLRTKFVTVWRVVSPTSAVVRVELPPLDRPRNRWGKYPQSDVLLTGIDTTDMQVNKPFDAPSGTFIVVGTREVAGRTFTHLARLTPTRSEHDWLLTAP